MAFNPFIGWTQADLETQLRAAQEELAAGKMLTSNSVGDTSFTAEREGSIIKRIEQIYRALNVLDSDTYPLASIVSPNRGTITSADYR